MKKKIILKWVFKMKWLFVLLVSKVWLCCVIFFQNIRKSGFGASDELSSEEEEGSPPEEIDHPVSLQERHPVATWPASSPSSSVRKRNLKLNHKPSLRPQVSFVLSAAAGHCSGWMDEWMNQWILLLSCPNRTHLFWDYKTQQKLC